MLDEEREAVEYWKTHMKILHLNTQLASEHYIKVLLDLVEKQSKEIERINEILTWKQKYEEQLQKEIEELKEKNEYLPSWVNRKYISKDKIKAKIEEIKNAHTGGTRNVISVLQSLLEKE